MPGHKLPDAGHPREAMTRAEFKQHFPQATEAVLRLSCEADTAPVQFITSSPAAEREAELREDIRKEIVRRGWAVFCGAPRATGRTLGEVDLTVAADNGRVYWIELKAKDGKTSPAQNAVHAHLRKLGHAVGVIRSLEEFRAFVDQV